MLKLGKILSISLIVLLASAVIFGCFVFVKDREEFSYENTRQAYISSCQETMEKQAVMSKQKLHSSCNCSHDNFLNIFGKKDMKKFTKILIEGDSEQINQFIKDAGYPMSAIDDAFLMCF